MITVGVWALCLFLSIVQTVSADQQNIQVNLTEDEGREMRLAVRQAPLYRVLDKIADATGVRIHYSTLPQELLSTTCSGTAVKQIVSCLLDRKADFIFKFPRVAVSGKALKGNPVRQPEEIWVLGTSSASVVEEDSAGHESTDRQQSQALDRLASVEPINSAQTGIDEVDRLLKMSVSRDPAQRLDAVALLAMQGRAGDLDIRKALETALSDPDASVRAQALSSLARREGDGAAAQLQAALQDTDSSVRLMAVDNAGDNPALLQQAITDSDETVRTWAAMKLEALAKAGG